MAFYIREGLVFVTHLMSVKCICIAYMLFSALLLYYIQYL